MWDGRGARSGTWRACVHVSGAGRQVWPCASLPQRRISPSLPVLLPVPGVAPCLTRVPLHTTASNACWTRKPGAAARTASNPCCARGRTDRGRRGRGHLLPVPPRPPPVPVPVCLCACAPVCLCACAPVCLCACAPVRLCACAPVRRTCEAVGGHVQLLKPRDAAQRVRQRAHKICGGTRGGGGGKVRCPSPTYRDGRVASLCKSDWIKGGGGVAPGAGHVTPWRRMSFMTGQGAAWGSGGEWLARRGADKAVAQQQQQQQRPQAPPHARTGWS